jgi:hypothetical protein
VLVKGRIVEPACSMMLEKNGYHGELSTKRIKKYTAMKKSGYNSNKLHSTIFYYGDVSF